jgi:Ca2+-binding RTX toxin-like protein
MAGAADVTIDGGSGIDTLTINANVDLSASTLNLTSVEQIQLVGGGLTQTLAASYITGKSFLISESGGGNADLTISMDQTSVDLSGLGFASSFETVNDGITVNASGLGLSATIVGSAADDTITGTSGADSNTAGGGADTINAGGGADTINLSETTALVDTVIFDSTSGNDQITGFSFAGDIIQLDRSALGLGSADDTVDAAEVDASTGTKTAAADILILSTAAGYATNNAMETAIQAIYAAGGGSGAGDAVIVYYNSTSEEIVMVYDDDLDVDGGATATIATFVGTDAGDLSDITAADFSFIA